MATYPISSEVPSLQSTQLVKYDIRKSLSIVLIEHLLDILLEVAFIAPPQLHTPDNKLPPCHFLLGVSTRGIDFVVEDVVFVVIGPSAVMVDLCELALLEVETCFFGGTVVGVYLVGCHFVVVVIISFRAQCLLFSGSHSSIFPLPPLLSPPLILIEFAVYPLVYLTSIIFCISFSKNSFYF
jgi:hypothetical protein